jgi:hypothetical protein
VSEGFWRGGIGNPIGVLTLEALQEAFDRALEQPLYPEPVHIMRNDRQWCDLCGPKRLYDERTWSILHGPQ